MSKFSALRRRALAEEAEYHGETPTAAGELGLAMVESGLAPALLARLKQPGPFALVIMVPTDQHASVVREGLELVLPDPSYVINMPGRAQTLTLPALENGLAQGRVVIAICSRREQVPISFLAVADDIVEMGGHDMSTVRRAMRKVLGKPIPRFPPDLVLHPDPLLVCKCIVPRLTPSRVVLALSRLTETMVANLDERLPPLGECVEYGRAREWGLRVIEDIQAWRAGRLAASDLDANCLLVSPPGHGKTRFARTSAQSLGAPLFGRLCAPSSRKRLRRRRQSCCSTNWTRSRGGTSPITTSPSTPA
jgi:cell division protease FtsH